MKINDFIGKLEEGASLTIKNIVYNAIDNALDFMPDIDVRDFDDMDNWSRCDLIDDSIDYFFDEYYSYEE